MQLLSGQIPPSPRSDFVPTTLDRLGAEWLAQCRIEGKTPQTVRTYSETLRVLQQSASGGAAGILPADVAPWTRRHLVSFFSWYSEHKHGGGPPQAGWVQELAGHSDPKTTLPPQAGCGHEARG